MSNTLTNTQLKAEILLLRGIPVFYSYLVPEELTAVLKTGMHVNIPLGRSTCVGVVMSIDKHIDTTMKLKHINSINDSVPELNSEQLYLIKAFSDFYQCTPFKAYQTIIGKRKYRPGEKGADINATSNAFVLNDEQQAAFNTVMASTGYSEHLIHGITGSGKTEIYMQLASELLKQNKSVLVLCPEISLTPQYTRHFTERFGDKVSVVHSNLTPKQRDIAWSNAKDGLTPIIIGPRSAVFSPNSNLGMIIIDEEHDGSYKQDSHPRYHTHRIARLRCRFHNVPLVLGSATPSINTFKLCKYSEETTIKRSYSHLSQRATGSTLPNVTVLDMSEEAQSKHPSISQALVDKIKEKIEAKEKVLLLLNRRGFAPYIVCQRCKEVHVCPSCDLSYTYHQDKSFRCHRCDITLPVSHTCQKCKKPGLAFQGTGIQKVESACRDLFQEAHILRLDKDTAKTAKQMEAILTEFKQKGDILIGTQLISKGHHIEDITFVGVLGIDTSLNLPDYSSSEQAFQLLMQVSGRAGRGAKSGEVMIQSLQADHYAIESASKQDFFGFIEQELEFRQQLNYPPFCTITHVIFSSMNKEELSDYCASVRAFCNDNKPDGVLVMGPKPAPFEKVRLHWRYHVLIKHDESGHEAVNAFIACFPKASKNIRVIIDKDPQQLL